MNSRFATIFCVLFVFKISLSSFAFGRSQWKLKWREEFNKEGALNPEVWKYEQRFERNHEAQWYQPQNAVCHDGKLVITARKEHKKNPYYNPKSSWWGDQRETIEYTSSSVKTQGTKSFLYGRLEVRAKIPTAQGAWPAIWLLGSGKEWPSCGEIDIMEFYRVKERPYIFANAAWGKDKRYEQKWNTKRIPYEHFTQKDKDWGKKYHIWRMDWDSTSIKIYLDKELLNEVDLNQTFNGEYGKYTNPFRQPMYLLLNLAIGGIEKALDENALPMVYMVDYVRYYQKE